MVNYYALPGLKGKVKVPTVGSKRLLVEYIIDTVCKYFKVDKELVFSESRKTEYRVPRQIIHWYLITKLKMSREKIGIIFNKDQSTITHSLNVVNNSIKFQFDNDYKTHVNALNSIL